MSENVSTVKKKKKKKGGGSRGWSAAARGDPDLTIYNSSPHTEMLESTTLEDNVKKKSG